MSEMSQEALDVMSAVFLITQSLVFLYSWFSTTSKFWWSNEYKVGDSREDTILTYELMHVRKALVTFMHGVYLFSIIIVSLQMKRNNYDYIAVAIILFNAYHATLGIPKTHNDSEGKGSFYLLDIPLKIPELIMLVVSLLTNVVYMWYTVYLGVW